MEHFHFYLAMTFWLMVVLLEAYGIFQLWQALVRPRWIHLVLLPGTLVAETAHFVAAMITGAPVREARLVSDEPLGDTQASDDAKQGVPVISPLVMALLPILAAVAIIYALYANLDKADWVGDSMVASFATGVDRRDNLAGQGTDALYTVARRETSDRLLADRLDWRLGAWFDLGRDLLTVSERLLKSLPSKGWANWLFVYLSACLAIRMVPLRGNLRGGMAAIVLVGALAFALGQINKVHDALADSWTLLAFVIGLLTALLLATLLVRAAVALVFVLADKPHPAPPG